MRSGSSVSHQHICCLSTILMYTLVDIITIDPYNTHGVSFPVLTKI